MNIRAAVLGVLVGSLSAIGQAHATGVQIHGAALTNMNASQASCPQRSTLGVTNTCSGAANFILGATKLDNATALNVWIDGYHSTAQTTVITVYVYSFSGSLLTSQQVTVPMISGSWNRLVQIGSSATPWTGYLSVVVDLPGQNKARINGVGIYHM
jgi:hypothetical protein